MPICTEFAGGTGLEPRPPACKAGAFTRRHLTPLDLARLHLTRINRSARTTLAPLLSSSTPRNRKSLQSGFLEMERAGLEPATSGLQNLRFAGCLRRDGLNYADSVRLRRVRSAYSGTRS